MVARGGGAWGRDGLGVWGQQCKLLGREWINKVLLYSTGAYIQYSVINHNGKEYEKECTYMGRYIYIAESLCYIAEMNTL